MTIFECVFYLDLNRKMLTYDRRSEPRVGERVPYVIIYGTPGVPLIQLVRRPVEVLQDPTLRLNATYYITKQILPSLATFFNLLDGFRPRVHFRSITDEGEQDCQAWLRSITIHPLGLSPVCPGILLIRKRERMVPGYN